MAPVKRRSTFVLLPEAQCAYFRENYVPGTNPMKFIVNAERMGSGAFVIHCASRFGWHIRKTKIATWARWIDQSLVNDGLRVRKFARRRSSLRDPNGKAHVHHAIRDIHKYR